MVRLEVPIKNCGTRDLIIDSVGFFPADETPDCSVASEQPTCALDANGQSAASPFGCDPMSPFATISPGSTDTVLTDFAPDDEQEHAATFAICSNDPTHEPVLITASGRGVPAGG
jgi:hypothetical protein